MLVEIFIANNIFFAVVGEFCKKIVALFDILTLWERALKKKSIVPFSSRFIKGI